MISIPENFQRYTDYLPLFFLSLSISIILTPIIGHIARKLNIVANPPSMRTGTKPSDYRHLEKQPTPLLGGIAILTPLIVLILIHTKPTPSIIYFISSIAVLLVGGLIDDKYEVSFKFQLFYQFAAALLILISPINLTLISNPVNGTIPLDLATFNGHIFNLPIDIVFPGDIIFMVWILICINAVKWVGGTDGLMEGNSLITSFILFILSIRFLAFDNATIAIIFSGLLAGFLFFNFYPAKIRSGSSGKSSYGFILAVLSVLCGAKFATAIIILMLPLIDFTWVIIRRIVVYQPKKISAILAISDQTHLHHKLLQLGLSEPQVALVEYAATATLGATALAFTGAVHSFAVLSSLIIVIVAITLIRKLVKKREDQPAREKDPDETPESKYSY